MNEVIYIFSIFLFDIYKLQVLMCGWFEQVEGGLLYRFIEGFDISNKGEKLIFVCICLIKWQCVNGNCFR